MPETNFNPDEWEVDNTATGLPSGDTQEFDLDITGGFGDEAAAAKAQLNALGFTDDDLKRAAEQFNPEAYDVDQTSTLDYIINSAKLGLTDTPSLLNALAETVVVDPAKALAWYAGLDVKPPPNSPITSFFNSLARSQQALAPFTGVDLSMQPPSTEARYTGAVVRAVSDPVNLVFPGGKLSNILVSGVAGGTGELGAEVGKHVAGQTGEVIGGLVGGVVGGGAPAALKSAAAAPAINALSKWRAYKQAASDAPITMAAGNAQRLLERATQELTPESLNEIIEDYSRIAHQLGDKDIPLFVAMSDNPTLRAQMVGLVKTDPAVRAVVQRQLDALTQGIVARADVLFDPRGNYVNLRGDTVSTKNVSKRVQTIDSEINAIGEGLRPQYGPDARGTAIKNLIKAKMSSVRDELSPQYTALYDEARAANVMMSPQGTQEVYEFVKQNKLRDIFGKGTKLDKLIMQHFKPADGKGYKEVSFDNIGSLNRELNELRRSKQLTPDEKRRLNQLDDVVMEARKNIPADYNNRLIDIDRQYYLRMGVPFGKQGVKDINAKKYAEQIAPVIASKPSAMKQFLSAVGADGHGVAADAVMSQVYTQFVKDGVLNVGQLRKYMRDNAETIRLVPGLQDKLTAASTDVSVLIANKHRLEKAAQAQDSIIANNYFNRHYEGINFNQLTASMMADPGHFHKVMVRDIKSLSPDNASAVRNSVRREVVHIAVNSPEGAINYLTKPEHATQLAALFGTQYRSSVMDLAKMSDAVKRADVTKLADSLHKPELEKRILGLTPSTTLSVIRDRITSVTQKIGILGSRSATHLLDTASKEAIVELLTNPEGLKRLSSMNKELPNLRVKGAFEQMQNQFIDLVPAMFLPPAKLGIMRESQEREQQQQ